MWLLMDSPNTNLFGPQFVKDDETASNASGSQQAVQVQQIRRPIAAHPATYNPLSPSLIQQAPIGRYAAPKPTCSMGQVKRPIFHS